MNQLMEEEEGEQGSSEEVSALDNRTADNRTPDNRTDDNRTADNRTLDSRTPESRARERQDSGLQQECVVISDDDSESAPARYQNSKRARLAAADSVVMITDEDQPGPSSRDDSVVMVTRPPNPIPVLDDDEPIITNVIDREERAEPVTWQLVRSNSEGGGAVRRNGYAVSRYRTRRPTARRAIRSREYGDFVNIVRDLTNEGVIISPLTRAAETVNSRRLRSYSRHFEGDAVRSYHGSDNAGTSRAMMGSLNDRTSAALSTRRGAVAHEELMHMTSLRDRITTLRRDLQNLNGLLTDSFELLHRIAPSPNLPRIDKSVLDRAPTKVATEADVSKDKTCSICLGHYSQGETLRVLPCDHEFHESCIDRWLTTCSRKCPFCRTDIHEALSLT